MIPRTCGDSPHQRHTIRRAGYFLNQFSSETTWKWYQTPCSSWPLDGGYKPRLVSLLIDHKLRFPWSTSQVWLICFSDFQLREKRLKFTGLLQTILQRLLTWRCVGWGMVDKWWNFHALSRCATLQAPPCLQPFSSSSKPVSGEFLWRLQSINMNWSMNNSFQCHLRKRVAYNAGGLGAESQEGLSV